MLNISNIMSCSNNLKNKMCPSGPMTPVEMHPYFEVSGTTAHMKTSTKATKYKHYE